LRFEGERVTYASNDKIFVDEFGCLPSWSEEWDCGKKVVQGRGVGTGIKPQLTRKRTLSPPIDKPTWG
jgi:hypothetical protein